MLARNLIPALVPLLVVVAIALTLPAARRLGNVLAAGLLAYSLGFCVWASFSPDLQRPDWDAVASRHRRTAGAAGDGHLALGEASLRYYLATGAFQVTSAEGYDWLVHEIDFVSDGKAPPPPPQLLGPGFREVGREDVGRLFVRRYSLPGPGLAPLRLRAAAERRAQLPDQRRPPGWDRPRLTRHRVGTSISGISCPGNR